MSGAKKKLTISRVNTQTKAAPSSPEFSAMLNPAKYTRTSAVFYRKPQATRKGYEQEQKLLEAAVDKLDFDELVFDGTGIVDAPPGTGDVDRQINLLRQVLNDPANDGNVVNAVVDIAWGTLLFRGRIASMTVNYTLFDASGKPLRARVKLSFVAYDQTSVKLATGAGGPLTRRLRPMAGVSLPLLCFTEYGDPSLVQAVAHYNKLTTFRRLSPSAELDLPKFG